MDGSPGSTGPAVIHGKHLVLVSFVPTTAVCGKSTNIPITQATLQASERLFGEDNAGSEQHLTIIGLGQTVLNRQAKSAC